MNSQYLYFTLYLSPQWGKNGNGEQHVFKVYIPELAMLEIQVVDFDKHSSNDCIGYNYIPMDLIRQGYRFVPLYNIRNDCLTNRTGATLFVHIKIETEKERKQGRNSHTSTPARHPSGPERSTKSFVTNHPPPMLPASGNGPKPVVNETHQALTDSAILEHEV